MKAIDQAKNLSAQRLDQFLDSALSNHLNEFRSVYAVFLKKSSESHVDFLDLFFTWNFEGAWKTHRGRPTNRNISEGAKWDPNEWIWYEDCPHQHYSGVSLFDGNHFFSDSDYHREDRLIQQKLQEENSQLLVIVSDWLMPGAKGDEFLIQVHEQFPEVVKSMLTGQADPLAVQRAEEEANLHACLGKPWKEQELVELIKSAIASL